MRKLAISIIAAFALTACEPPASQHPFSSAELAGLQTLMDDAVAGRRIPSAIAMLAHEDDIIWIGAAGEIEPGAPMRDDAILPLASVGKIYTATAVMILVERGQIALTDPVTRFIPEFADARVQTPDGLIALDRPITVFDLLTHTAGLLMTGDAFWDIWNAHSERTTTTDFARALVAHPLQAQPGARFEYGPTGASYEVLGAVVEIVSGQTLEAFMSENIFAPLGLEDTYFFIPDAKAERLPAFYRTIDGVLTPDRARGEEFPRSTFFHGGGGVSTSARDLLRFMQIFLNEGAVDGVRILSAGSVRAMMTDHVGALSPFPTGLGWGFGGAVRGPEAAAATGLPEQYGWTGGGYSVLWVNPNERIVAYFIFPIAPPGDNDLLNDFRTQVATAMAE